MSELCYLVAWPTWLMDKKFRDLLLKNRLLFDSLVRWTECGSPCPHCLRCIPESEPWAVCTRLHKSFLKDGVNSNRNDTSIWLSEEHIPQLGRAETELFRRRGPTPQAQLSNAIDSAKQNLERNRKVPILSHQWIEVSPSVIGCTFMSCYACATIEVREKDKSFRFPWQSTKPDKVTKQVTCKNVDSHRPTEKILTQNSRIFMQKFLEALIQSPKCMKCHMPFASAQSVVPRNNNGQPLYDPVTCGNCKSIICTSCIEYDGGKEIKETYYERDGKKYEKDPGTRFIEFNSWERKQANGVRGMHISANKKTVVKGYTTRYWMCSECKEKNIVKNGIW